MPAAEVDLVPAVETHEWRPDLRHGPKARGSRRLANYDCADVGTTRVTLTGTPTRYST